MVTLPAWCRAGSVVLGRLCSPADGCGQSEKRDGLARAQGAPWFGKWGLSRKGVAQMAAWRIAAGGILRSGGWKDILSVQVFFRSIALGTGPGGADRFSQRGHETGQPFPFRYGGWESSLRPARDCGCQHLIGANGTLWAGGAKTGADHGHGTDLRRGNPRRGAPGIADGGGQPIAILQQLRQRRWGE